MPLNVRRFCTSVTCSFCGFAVFPLPRPYRSPRRHLCNVTQPSHAVKAPTSGEVMRDRISKAKAFIAVRNYNAAIYELENIRRETGDPSVQGVVNVLLMNSYLEQGDYKRAQDFLTEFYNIQKTTKPNATDLYYGRCRPDRQRCPQPCRPISRPWPECVATARCRSRPLTTSRKCAKRSSSSSRSQKRSARTRQRPTTAMGLLEEATNSRSMLARDDYDARRWKDEVADSREELANSRCVITNAVDGTTTPNAVQPSTINASVPAKRSRTIPNAVSKSTADRAGVIKPVPAETHNQPSETSWPLPKSLLVPEPKKSEEPDTNAGRSKCAEQVVQHEDTSRF